MPRSLLHPIDHKVGAHFRPQSRSAIHSPLSAVIGAAQKALHPISSPWSKILIGRSVANREAEGRKLGVLTGLPAMGLDGLGSASYGPEAALSILAVTGASGLGPIGPVTWVKRPAGQIEDSGDAARLSSMLRCRRSLNSCRCSRRLPC